MKRVLEIFRDGKTRKSYLTVPLRDGEQGNFQTLAEMSKIVNEDRTQPDLRIFVLREIVGDVAGHDFFGELESVFRFCRDSITYRNDPFGVERVADMWSTMYALNPNGPEGDCGIKSTFFATCAALLGHRPFFVVIKQLPEMPNFNHVYCGVDVAGERRFYDPTPEDKPAGWESPAYEKKLYPIFT